MNKIRTADDSNRYRLALVAPDQAFFASEQKYGVGRLERLVSTNTLSAYQRGWDAYRAALDDGDADALEIVGPKMIAALTFMDAEATEAGHKPLAPETWEAPLPDGRVLCVVRSQAEASAVIRASNASDGQVYETTLPPDLAVTIRSQHEGRALVVVTLEEIGRLLAMAEAKAFGTAWEGTPAHSGVQQGEMAAYDLSRSGYPLDNPIPAAPPPHATLEF